jgi:hypothetical protein
MARFPFTGTMTEELHKFVLRDGGWVAVFAAAEILGYAVGGMRTVQFPLIWSLYACLGHQGGSLRDAFRPSVPDADTHLVDRF